LATGPTPPERSVCAPGAIAFLILSQTQKETTMKSCAHLFVEPLEARHMPSAAPSAAAVLPSGADVEIIIHDLPPPVQVRDGSVAVLATRRDKGLQPAARPTRLATAGAGARRHARFLAAGSGSRGGRGQRAAAADFDARRLPGLRAARSRASHRQP